MISTKEMNKKLNQAGVKSVKISFNEDYEEYRVNYIGGKEATAYYTSDDNDAFNTAIAMNNKSASNKSIPECRE